MAIHVVKLGGSLLDLPDLRERIEGFRRAKSGSGPLFVVGGGDAAETVRRFDRHFQLDETIGHWLAVRAMQFNAHLLSTIMPGSHIVADASECKKAWSLGELPIADPLLWLKQLENEGREVPHSWSFTSDSIAAHIAVCLGAQKLSLLKSTLPTTAASACSAGFAASLGVVDSEFPQACAAIPQVELVNLRGGTGVGDLFESCVLQPESPVS